MTADYCAHLVSELADSDRVGSSDTLLWRLERAGKFPCSIRISPGAVAWGESGIEQWITERAEVGREGRG